MKNFINNLFKRSLELSSAPNISSPEDLTIIILDSYSKEISVATFNNGDDCYDSFTDLCRFYEEASYENKSIEVEFPNGYFGVGEDDEAIEDYGTLMFVFEDGDLSLIVEQNNPEYYEN